MSVSAYFHQTPDALREELQWVTQAKLDPKKFEPLYRKYYTPILRYLKQRVADQEIAHDLVSQVFIKAINKIHQYEFRGVPFGSWLYRIAKSELYQQFRDDKFKHSVQIETIQLAGFEEMFSDSDEQEVNRKRLLAALQFLKAEQLQLIELRFFEQLSFKEIGEQLGLTENNAKVKTFRALEKLRSYFLSTKNAA
jgi:RNA polymerase sigma-70 factor (ECF subfamily)